MNHSEHKYKIELFSIHKDWCHVWRDGKPWKVMKTQEAREKYGKK